MPLSRQGDLPSDLAGRLSLVTGAAHGIGLAIARRLTASGSKLIAVDNDSRRLDEAFSAGECIPVLADMASEEIPALADSLVREHGPIQLIVNNVGTTTAAGFLELEPAEFDLVFRTNLTGPWFFTRQLARSLVDAGAGGSILFISSVHDTFVHLNPHYSASKAGVAMLVKELAYELAPHGIRVNAISPGWIKTEEDVDPARAKALSQRIPIGRPGEPDEVARLAVVLLSDEWSAYLTGVNVRVDGGLSLHSWQMDL